MMMVAHGVFFSFSYNLGACTITQAELWAILIGIQIACSRPGFKDLCIESDSTTAINIIKQGCPNSNISYPLVAMNMIQDFTLRVACFNWCHIYREANQLAGQVWFYSCSTQG